nr:MAG TPA: hypothetical protein [Caudoviricetes sp.]
MNINTWSEFHFPYLPASGRITTAFFTKLGIFYTKCSFLTIPFSA